MTTKHTSHILHHPDFSIVDIQSQQNFKLDMEGLGGRGIRTGPLASLIKVMLFRLGMEYQLKEVYPGEWTASLAKRGKRKVISMGPWNLSGVNEAESWFLFTVMKSTAKTDRLRYFNVWPAK